MPMNKKSEYSELVGLPTEVSMFTFLCKNTFNNYAVFISNIQ